MKQEQNRLRAGTGSAITSKPRADIKTVILKIMCLIAAVLTVTLMPLTALAAAEPSPTAEPIAQPSPTPAPAEPTKEPASAEPSGEPAPITEQLRIDSDNVYEGMDRSYADGYVPTVQDGRVRIVLPLMGETFKNSVSLTADLGPTADSPFVFGNYSQSAGGEGLYVFTMEISLVSGRINGSYPVLLTASYLDAAGAAVSQTFTVYVTITDGKAPPDPTAVVTPPKETVDKPELFISACAVEPGSVGGNEEFSVKLTIENIGSIRARSIRLSYGGAAAEGTPATIIPVETNNALHLENLSPGKSAEVSFKLKTTKDALAGNQPFGVTLDYIDIYGGVYSGTRQFLIGVVQPAELSYDPVEAPKSITAGETFTLPANIFNIGKSTLRNVTVSVAGAGLFPAASVFLGDIAPGATGSGEISVFAGQLSMSEGYSEDYGKTDGLYTISYSDDGGTAQKIEIAFATEILKPVIEGEEDEEQITQQPAFQWWVTILVGLAIIAVIAAVVVAARVTRSAKLR